MTPTDISIPTHTIVTLTTRIGSTAGRRIWVGGNELFPLSALTPTKWHNARLDYFVTSGKLLERVVESDIRSEAYGASDHCPIYMILKLWLRCFARHDLVFELIGVCSWELVELTFDMCTATNTRILVWVTCASGCWSRSCLRPGVFSIPLKHDVHEAVQVVSVPILPFIGLNRQILPFQHTSF